MKTCTKCQAHFEVNDQDRSFYKKVSPVFKGQTYLMPEPTLCPNCRHQRRMTWRNDRTFYHRKCDLTGKPFISIYSPEVPDPVYHPDAWWSDNWDAMDYGQEFDFSRPFFDQYIEVNRKVPKNGISIANCENSYYCNYCGDDKNCYLDIAGEANEDCYFNLFTKYSKDCCDTTFNYHSSFCYESIQVYNGYNLKFSQYCNNTSDSAFVYDMIGCKNCLFSYNQRNKEYLIFNEPHSPEEYEKKKAEILNGSYSTLQSALEIWQKNLKEKVIFRDSYQVNCENSNGNNLNNCKNTHYSFNATNCEDGKYLFDVLDAKDCQDMNYSLYKPEAAYEIMSTLQTQFSAFLTGGSTYNSNCYYGDMIQNSSNLFGCVALRNKKYCILNKQYTQEEYETLVPKIIEHMRSTGEWGEFFPSHLSPWGYNETFAMEHMPLSKEEAIAKGFKWHEGQQKSDPKAQAYGIPDNIKDVSESILNEILACIDCRKNYKIVSQELKYYKRGNLPIPRKCPDCRHRDRINLRTPRRLFQRTCSNCSREIQSSFSAERSERVYCEDCYLSTVY